MSERVKSALRLKRTHDSALLSLVPEFQEIINCGDVSPGDHALDVASKMDKYAYEATFKAMGL